MRFTVEPLAAQENGRLVPHPHYNPVLLARSVYRVRDGTSVIVCPDSNDGQLLARTIRGVDYIRVGDGRRSARCYCVGVWRGAVGEVRVLLLLATTPEAWQT